jgi:hypothetical protein
MLVRSVTIQVDLTQLPGQAQRILSPEAPPPLRMMAAKGVIPGLKPGDIVTVIALLTDHADPNVAQTARATLDKLPPPILTGALQADLPAAVIALLAPSYATAAEVVEQLLRMPRIDASALEHMAQVADERCGEIIATNEQLMLKYPTVIEKLYMNKRVRMSTADRLVELAVRNHIELAIPAFRQAAAAIMNELMPEPTAEPTPDDILFRQTQEIAAVRDVKAEEDTHETDDEGEEHVRREFLPLHAQVAKMTVSQKIRAAMLGNAAVRLLLIRDPNRLVATAAVRSPNMREDEAVRITLSRAVSEDVLREIALNREFTRSYQVKLNLIGNPRTPLTFAARMIPHLRDNDLRALAKSKNVSSAIAQAVRQQLERKKGKQQ